MELNIIISILLNKRRSKTHVPIRDRHMTKSKVTSWRGTILDKLTVTQPVKKFPAFYATRRFITVLTRTRHWSPAWIRSIQSTPLHAISPRSFLILSSYLRLGLQSRRLPSSFLTKILHAFLTSHIRATCTANLDFIILTTLL